MILYPDVQKRGQQELEKFTPSRLPVFEDLPRMPYIRAIMLEVLRSDPHPFITLVIYVDHIQVASCAAFGKVHLCLSDRPSS